MVYYGTMKNPISTAAGVRSIVGGTLVITALTALMTLATANTAVPGSPIQSLFIPMNVGTELVSGSYGQTNDGGFVCYGTVEKLPRLMPLTDVEYGCNGVKATFEEHVKTKIGGTYLGATFLYKNPSLVAGYRGVYSVGGTRPGISGVVVYYK